MLCLNATNACTFYVYYLHLMSVRLYSGHSTAPLMRAWWVTTLSCGGIQRVWKTEPDWAGLPNMLEGLYLMWTRWITSMKAWLSRRWTISSDWMMNSLDTTSPWEVALDIEHQTVEPRDTGRASYRTLCISWTPNTYNLPSHSTTQYSLCLPWVK